MPAQVVATLIGLWLYASPSLLDYGGTAAAVDRIAGALIVTFSFVAIWEFLRGVRLANRPLAVVLLVVPWFLDQPTAGLISSVAGGAAVLALSFVEGKIQRRYGGGWSVLLRNQRGSRDRS